MIRLNINVPPYVVGDLIDPAHFTDAFTQELLDAGQATRLADDASTDPVDLVLGEVFELEDQIDAALGRRARILVLAEGLDDEGRARVDAALATASRVRPELFGLADLASGDLVDQLKADLAQVRGVLQERSNRVAALERGVSADALLIGQLKADLAAATTSSIGTTPARPPGDVDEASASSAEPTATAPVKPAASKGGTAKAKSGS